MISPRDWYKQWLGSMEEAAFPFSITRCLDPHTKALSIAPPGMARYLLLYVHSVISINPRRRQRLRSSQQLARTLWFLRYRNFRLRPAPRNAHGLLAQVDIDPNVASEQHWLLYA